MIADIVPAGWNIGGILIAIVIIAACIALVAIALRQFGIAIPQWVIQCFWVVAVAFVVVVCIKIVLSL